MHLICAIRLEGRFYPDATAVKPHQRHGMRASTNSRCSGVLHNMDLYHQFVASARQPASRFSVRELAPTGLKHIAML